MENFLSELTELRENNALETMVLKEKLKSLNESFQKEQIKSKIIEHEYLQNVLKLDLNSHNNEEMDIKLNYYHKESEYLQAQINRLNTRIESLKKSLENKEETHAILTKEITNYQENIAQITANNKNIEETFKMNLLPLDLKALGLNLNKKSRISQKNSFLDFLNEKKLLQAKNFKLKLKFSDLKLKKKQDLMKLSLKMVNFKYNGDTNKISLLSQNEKIIRNLQYELEEKKAFIEKQYYTEPLDLIADSQEKTLTLQLSTIKKNFAFNEKKMKYMDFRISRLNCETSILINLIELFKQKVSKLLEIDFGQNIEEYNQRKKISQAICSEIDNIKCMIHQTNENCIDFEGIYRNQIKDLNSLKFELCVFNSSEIPKNQSFAPDLMSYTHIDDIFLKSTIGVKANTIQSIDKQEEIIYMSQKKKEKDNSFHNLFGIQKKLKISNIDHYQLSSKLNSLKEDHLLFSNFIDFRLNPSKYQKLQNELSSKSIDNIHENHMNNHFNLNLERDITNSEKPIPLGYRILELTSPPLDLNSDSFSPPVDLRAINRQMIDEVESWENLEFNDLEIDQEIEKVLEEEVIVSWGKHRGLVNQLFNYSVMLGFLLFSRPLNFLLNTIKRVHF